MEAANGALQRALEQHLLLRGQRDFASVATYEAFLTRIFTQRNARREVRLAEELARMRPLVVDPLPDRRELRVRVSAGGLLRVLAHSYSVASGLAGKLVTALVGEWEITVWYGGRCWETLPRLTARNAHRIQYRHVIDTLLRKPGGFRDYRYRDDLFPTAVFRQAWEALCHPLAAAAGRSGLPAAAQAGGADPGGHRRRRAENPAGWWGGRGIERHRRHPWSEPAAGRAAAGGDRGGRPG